MTTRGGCEWSWRRVPGKSVGTVWLEEVVGRESARESALEQVGCCMFLVAMKPALVRSAPLEPRDQRPRRSRFRMRRAHSHRTLASKTPLDDRAHCRFRSSDRSAHLSRCALAPSRESSQSTRSRMQVYRDRRMRALGAKVGDAFRACERRERCRGSAMVRANTTCSARRHQSNAIDAHERRELLA